MPRDFVAIDVETGGLDPATDALLEVGMVSWRGEGWPVRMLQIAVLPEGLRVQPEALAVNGIVLEKHAVGAVSREKAAELVSDWLGVAGNGRRVTPLGHNIAFDLGFLRVLLGAEQLEKLFSHRAIDTVGILRFLCDAGLVDLEKHSLDAACAHFGLFRARAHSALDDAAAAAELYGCLLKLLRHQEPAASSERLATVRAEVWKALERCDARDFSTEPPDVFLCITQAENALASVLDLFDTALLAEPG